MATPALTEQVCADNFVKEAQATNIKKYTLDFKIGFK
jgi:hypothetical protein